MHTLFFGALLISGFMSVLGLSPAWAQATSSSNSEFFSIREVPAEDLHSESSEASYQVTSVADFFWEEVQAVVQTGARVYTLLSFDRHKGNYGEVIEPYNRNKHFRGWVYPEGDCRNTRAQVLAETSSVPVKMSSNGCTVLSGSWQDPYTAQTFEKAQDLQIDHFVPLKNAYISGADRWSFKQRCLYANYQGNEFHLLPVMGFENQKKSDRTPQEYMPPNTDYRCAYLGQWLKVKLIWALRLSPSEKSSIESLVKSQKCSASHFTYTDAELHSQRDLISRNQNLCSP